MKIKRMHGHSLAVLALLTAGAAAWMSLSGCGVRRCNSCMDCGPFDWRIAPEVITLRDTTAIVDIAWVRLADDSVKVRIGLDRPADLNKAKQCDIMVLLEASALEASPELSLLKENTYLQLPGNETHLLPSSRSWTRRCDSGLQVAEAAVCFDLAGLDSTMLNSSKLVIHLDSSVVFGDQVFNLGRIELDGFRADTAVFVRATGTGD